MIKAITEKIQKSIPLEPILITDDDGFLCENQPRKNYQSDFPWLVKHTRSKSNFFGRDGSAVIGIHQTCGGEIHHMHQRIQFHHTTQRIEL